MPPPPPPLLFCMLISHTAMCVLPCCCCKPPCSSIHLLAAAAAASKFTLKLLSCVAALLYGMLGHKIKLYKVVASAAMEVCTHALLALPFLAILTNSPIPLAHRLLSCDCLFVQDLLAGKAAGKAALEVSTLDPVFDARAAHQLFALGQKYKGNAKAFALLICGRAPVQEILPALLVACQGMAPSEEVLTAAVNRLATDPGRPRNSELCYLTLTLHDVCFSCTFHN